LGSSRRIILLLLCAAALGARLTWAESPHLENAPRNNLYEDSETSDSGFDELTLGAIDDSEDGHPNTIPDTAPLVHNQKETRPPIPPLFAAATGILKDWNSPELPKIEPLKPVDRAPASKIPAETRQLTENAMEKEKEFQDLVTEASFVPATYQKILSVLTGGRVTPRPVRDTAVLPH